MVPGGTMEAALRLLGYQPYTFRHVFTKGRASTHPQEWCTLLDRKKRFDFAILEGSQGDRGFDALVGPPCTLAFEAILKECPRSTRVILVDEADKESWAFEANALWGPLLKQTERSARRRAGVHLHEMVQKMMAGMVEEVSGRRKRLPPAAALDALEQHIKEVVPRDRLLVYRLGDGWEPLCSFLAVPVPTSPGGEPLPFPPRDDGAADIVYLVERLQRVERVVWWVTCALIAGAIVLYAPFCAQLRDIVAAYYEDYCLAFEPVLEESMAAGGKITLRQALVLAKNTTMSFEEKWRQRGGVVGAAGEAFLKLTDTESVDETVTTDK
ncbi:hypothetical protein ERJ75_001443700 [Trypanosoma vivax]|nr:hypothetical protein ERJ75_001443700 [Trypanosoma vivax]